MNTFPNIDRKPEAAGYSREPEGEAVIMGQTASGYPVLNKIVTFEPDIIKLELPAVPDDDKRTVMDFYEDNKDVAFYWYDDQAKETLEVCFNKKPSCRLEDTPDLWRIVIELKQTASI